jgi:uncharacterized protein
VVSKLLLPELCSAYRATIRIPEQLDVPVTPRVRALLDTAPMQRLKRVSQLGLVGQVYPGAQHSRFEHSLGVYRLARHVLLELFQNDSAGMDCVSEEDCKVFLLAALLHDVGHWPYCHPIEDMRLDWVPRHEAIARRMLCDGELATVIGQQWEVDPTCVADFLEGPAKLASESEAGGRGRRLLQSVLNGPVDIDKMDYLQRDSLHAGVPYGRNFDLARLISSLRVAEDGASLALSAKGKTAAEMMVFARYVMFSEVYWHHAVRSATAMLQRLVYHASGPGAAEQWLLLSDAQFEAQVLADAHAETAVWPLAVGLFGASRQLYKRVGEYTVSEAPEVHAALSRRPYAEVTQCGRRLAEELSRRMRRPLTEHEVLIDAPPVKLEVQFRIPVLQPEGSTLRQVQLAQVSPVVNALATDQFDNYVKKVRVYIAPHRRVEVEAQRGELPQMLIDCAACR